MNYSATQMAKKLDISRSYLYYLKNNGVIQPELNEHGKPIWTEAIYQQLKDYIKKNRIKKKPKKEKPPLSTIKIHNRRYLGSKYKLLPFIQKVVLEECENVQTVADLFAGTGAVASAFTDKKLITNDIMYSNYICHLAWFHSEAYSEKKLSRFIADYNKAHIAEDNYMSEHFANTYFSLEDCRKIDRKSVV